MDIITNWLYWLTTGLLVPVIVFLLILFVRSLLLAGSFYGTYINRTKNKQKIKEALDNKIAGDFIQDFQLSGYPNSPLAIYINKIKENNPSKAIFNKLLGDYEILADTDLGKSKSLTKLGPMVGLMGTLIPMGPALVGLASGDVATMAHNMQVAFATTVLGVFIGAIGFITLQIKQRWYADDMNTLEYLTDAILEHFSDEEMVKNINYEKEKIIAS